MFQRIKILAKKRGLSINQVEEQLGYPRNTMYNWKIQTPSAERLMQVATFFNVSIDYLLGQEKKKEDNDISSQLDEMLYQLTQQQDALMYRGKILDDETKELVLASMQQAMKIAELNLKK